MVSNDGLNQEQMRNDSVHPSMVALGLGPNKLYGLDVVFERVRAEDILLPHDFDRIKKILTMFFTKSGVSDPQGAIGDPDALYLRRKYRTIERDYKNTFTELYLNSLVHMLPENSNQNDGEFRFRSQGRNKWTASPRKIEFLPDLQQTDVFYSKEDIAKLKAYLRRKKVYASSCLLIKVRAGIFLHNRSLLNLAELMNDKELDVQLYVKSEPYDYALDVNALTSAIKISGANRIIIDFPMDLRTKLNEMSSAVLIRTPDKSNNFNNEDSRKNTVERPDVQISSSPTYHKNMPFSSYQNAKLIMTVLAILKIFL